MNNIKKLVAVVLVGLSVGTVIPIQANAEWKQDNTGWWYAKESGGYYKNEWLNDRGKWYYFDSNGYMTHDTAINGYYFDNKGKVVNKLDINDEGADKNSEAYKAYYNLIMDTKELNKLCQADKYYYLHQCQIIDLNNDGELELVVSESYNLTVAKLLVFGYKNKQIYYIGNIENGYFLDIRQFGAKDHKKFIEIADDKETFLIRGVKGYYVMKYYKEQEKLVIEHTIINTPNDGCKMDGIDISNEEYKSILSKYNR